MFYLTTGFHGIHVTGGLIAFLFVLGRTYLARKFTHEQAVSAIVVSYYWHFVDVVWIGLFATIYLDPSEPSPLATDVRPGSARTECAPPEPLRRSPLAAPARTASPASSSCCSGCS